MAEVLSVRLRPHLAVHHAQWRLQKYSHTQLQVMSMKKEELVAVHIITATNSYNSFNSSIYYTLTPLCLGCVVKLCAQYVVPLATRCPERVSVYSRNWVTWESLYPPLVNIHACNCIWVLYTIYMWSYISYSAAIVNSRSFSCCVYILGLFSPQRVCLPCYMEHDH